MNKLQTFMLEVADCRLSSEDFTDRGVDAGPVNGDLSWRQIPAIELDL